MTELLLIVGVFVAGGNAKDPAGEHLGLRMSRVEWIAGVGDEFIDSGNQSESLINFPKQDQSAVGSHGSAIEVDVDSLSSQPCEDGAFPSRLFPITLCHCRKPWVRGL